MLDNGTAYAMVARPATGLLAGLLEFPSLEAGQEDRTTLLESHLSSLQLSPATPLTYCGPVLHIFSHIRMTYEVYRARVAAGTGGPAVRWVSHEEFQSCATSTAMKKVLKSSNSSCSGSSAKLKLKKTDSRQPSVSSFFSVPSKKMKQS